MNKHEWNFNDWCRKATGLIGFPPDQKAVSAELYAHLEDHFDALVRQGHSPEEAERLALEAMGDPGAIARELALLHRPFWGYWLQTCKILLVILLCLSLLRLGDYTWILTIGSTPNLWGYDTYDPESYGGGTGRTMLQLSQHADSFSESGNTFTLTDAALITTTRDDGSVTAPQLHVRIRQSSWLPQTEHTSYFGFYSVVGSFFARDSLGNHYEGYCGQSDENTHYMYNYGAKSGLFCRIYECWINDFPAEAEWVEICYERDGRSYTFRIDLTGGGNA